ncbi:glycoside hydrolase family 2 TIM barrel-domain containing protein [uncultured Duncaniella sp.]|nr:glycoside hydrolase family 2 TIM barrel-domain containing protein [uncultured Duncaniella sp.]
MAMASAFAADAKIPVPQDSKIRLNEGWMFVRTDLGNIWEAVRPVKKDNPEEYPFWHSVTLPHCFNAEDCVDPDVNYYQGPGWYKTQLSIENPYTDGRVMLEFEGAGQKTEVYVYTTKVGEHVGGYDSWNVDITDAVADFLGSEDAKRFGGKVPLSIRCDNTRDNEMIPSDISDFNIYGGIYRYLNLVYLPKVSVASLKIDTSLSGKLTAGRVCAEGTFYNLADVRNADVTVYIKDAKGNVVAKNHLKNITPLGTTTLIDTELKNPELWDVDKPQLYTCEVVVNTDGQESTATQKFGFRHFEFVEKGPFKLNGRRLLLRGTHRHEDHAGVAAAMTQDQIEKEMGMMKEMGVNFIRLGHYQQSEIVLDMCDSLGILVWEEIPWCRGGVGGEKYRNQAKRMLTNMVKQHYNHPAVIIWGLGNENDWPNDFPTFEQSEIRSFMSELNDLAHSLDPVRKTAIRRCEFCSDIVDVYSPTLWAGWYKGDYHDYVKYSQEAFDKVKHFLHVEWGGDSHPGRFTEDVTPTKNDWSEIYLAALIDWHLKEQEEMPWLTGTAYWPFKDFSTPVRPDNPVPYVNQKGVVERDFTKKEAYYIFQSYWTKKPMVHIFGHSEPVRWGEKGAEKEVLVFSNCPKVELFVNGISQGVRNRDSRNYPAAGLRWNVVLNEGDNEITAKAFTADKSIVEDSLKWDYMTRKWGEESKLAFTTQSSDDGTVTISVKVTDADGTQCMDSKRFVRFEIAGDGELIKNMGTAGASSRVQAANGAVSIKVKPNGGHSVVAVKSEGLPTEFINL